MAEVPELRAAVRASAERRVARRRPAWRLAPLVAAAAAVVLALVLLSRTADDEVPAVTVTPTATPTPTSTTDGVQASLGSVFAVFRRPQRASDRTPALRFEHVADQLTFDPAAVRRLAVSGAYGLYVIPGVENGEVALCVLITRGAKPAGQGCGPFDPAAVNVRPHWQKLFLRPAALYALLLPDGVDRVDVRLKSGEVLTKRVQDNAVLFQVKGFERVTWRDAAGVEHSSRMAI
ncbi:hypothetical protein [Solirubrobacter soli]|uniref:hypothetical protein n=1 Tax=Solirubrobacter soli TaxID=363832 RepID=UPI0003F84389|nr:hypothetical protein [Solirubrobacter soli]